MDAFDEELRQRLVRLEAGLPRAEPPVFHDLAARRRIQSAAAAVTAVALVLVVSTGAVVGVTTLANLVATPGEGVFNPGQPLHCSGVERMDPPAADRFLRSQGFDVTWQIENRDDSTSILAATPPAHGYIQDGVIHGDKLTIVVEVGKAAVPVHKDC